MAQGGGQLIVAGREHAAYCFEVLSCYFSGESPASPRFADHHWCSAHSPPNPSRWPLICAVNRRSIRNLVSHQHSRPPISCLTLKSRQEPLMMAH